MRVEVTEVIPQGTVAVGIGYDVDSGRTVRFGGDWRPMREVAEALDAGEDVEVEIESWQILG